MTETPRPPVQTNMASVVFREVGREKKSWTATIKRPVTYHALVREIRTHKALLSQDIDFDESNGGIYVGGIRRVGTFEISEEPSR